MRRGRKSGKRRTGAATRPPGRAPARLERPSRTGTVLTLIGLAVGLLSLLSLIELLPRLSVQASEPLSLLVPDAFATSFALTNDGYTSLLNVRVGCYVHSFTDSLHNTMERVIDYRYWPPAKDLLAGETETFPCRFGGTFGGEVGQADITIVARYSPWRFGFVRRTALFRFVANRTPGRKLSWHRQPVSEIREELDGFIAGLKGREKSLD